METGEAVQLCDRARKWAMEHAPTRVDGQPLREDLILQYAEWLRDAYLAGAEDYARHAGLRAD